MRILFGAKLTLKLSGFLYNSDKNQNHTSTEMRAAIFNTTHKI